MVAARSMLTRWFMVPLLRLQRLGRLHVAPLDPQHCCLNGGEGGGEFFQGPVSSA
jgi:hypothetical protein